MAKRTDIHSTSKIDPEGYLLVACDYHGGGPESMAYMGERIAFRAHMERTGGKWARITRSDGDDGSHGCYICGAACMYVARFWHKDTNTYIETGMDCADKMGIGDRVLFASFRKKIRAGIEAQAGKNKAQRILTDANLADAWTISQTQLQPDSRGRVPYEESTITDIVGKLVRYGSISDGQTKFLGDLLFKIADRPRIQAERDAKDAHRKAIPVGDKRMTIAGVIISAKIAEGDWGNTIKIVIEHADGWKVWGNMPRELADFDEPESHKGQRIQLDAAVVVSDTDPKFGFFKRPTKAALIEEHAT